jgi:hypothetical protein
MLHSAPTVVVGVDGSKAATNAATWAVDEGSAHNAGRSVFATRSGNL